jgi:uncharacterized protein YbjT (DUF2867 family)
MRVAVAGGTGVVGQHVVEALRRAGHEAVALSRAAGVDVESGTGLEAALAGVEVIVDALNPASLGRADAEAFFRATTRRLQEVGRAQGAAHLLTLSIVGIEKTSSYGYYAAKLAQEAEAQAGPLPATVLRATQFHEFAGQFLARLRVGRIAVVPRMRVQPVAARTVAEHLVRLAQARPGGRVELAGPEERDLPELARRLAGSRGDPVRVLPLSTPGQLSRQIREGALLAGPTTLLDGPGFDTWLTTDDARRVALRRPGR